MNRIFRRRLFRLEKRAASRVAKWKRRKPEEKEWQLQAALYHARKLVTLISRGDPQIDEPLAIAWERARGHLGPSDTPPERFRYQPWRVAIVDSDGRDTEIAEIAKSADVFRSAPSWLLDFCNASLDCYVLGIELPKNSEPEPEYGRDGLREACKAWPELPKGTIGAGRRVPKLNPMRTLNPDETTDLIALLEIGEDNWLRHYRHRYNEIMDKVGRASTRAYFDVTPQNNSQTK